MAMQPLALEAGIRDGASGPSRQLRRAALALAAAALALAVTGDRSRAAGVPAAISGQDPLEVLELKVRPNVIIVLDSSGSMTSNLVGPNTFSGDHPRSKMKLAKDVLVPFVTNNQDKASFLFGTYTQTGSRLNGGAGTNRFVYYTTKSASPSMATTPLRVTGDANQASRGFQAWMDIRAGWNKLYYEEDTNTSGPVTASCTATVPVAFYRDGASLATAIQTAMNAATCTVGARANTYTVVFNTTTAPGRFEFTRAPGGRNFRIFWGQTPNNIAGAVGRRGQGTTGWTGNGTIVTSQSYRLLYDGGNFTETVGGVPETYYQSVAARMWNGETIRLQADGRVCGVTAATAADMTVPAHVKLQQVDSSCGSDVGTPVTLTFAGGVFGGNNVSCSGFGERVALIPCDLQSPPAPLQIDTIGPFIEPQLTSAPFNADGTLKDYAEATDGSWAATTVPPETITVGGVTRQRGGAKADGWTPLGNTLEDIKGVVDCPGSATGCLNDPILGADACIDSAGTAITCPERVFSKLWNTGQSGATTMAGPAPWQLDPIKGHRDPKEKTIVILVTDGDDTCPNRSDGTGSNMDLNALRAAYKAQRLYTPLDAAEPASSVQTFVVGFGGAFAGGEPTRLNWIAWGGSGLGQGQPGQPAVNVTQETNDYDGDGTDDMDDYRWNETSTQLKTLRARCTTCQDAFIAPDAATLATQLQGIIDQGATLGDFNAQQSITESVYEYVDVVDAALYDAAIPKTRYRAIVPNRFISSFSLPGFKGHARAYQNDGAGNSIEKWDAGAKLLSLVSGGMMSACPTDRTLSLGPAVGECLFSELPTAIGRRIYTTDRNGLYSFTPDTLMDGTSTNRVSLWPPTSLGLPTTSYTSPWTFNTTLGDAALGLPTDSPTGFPPNPVDKFCDPLDTRPSASPKKAYDQCWFEWLQSKLQACVGPTLPSACTGGTNASRMQAARREAREIILAFMAGAKTVPDTTGIKRTIDGNASLIYTAREWILADSELATAAVVTPPLPAEPSATPYLNEYKLFRDGPRSGTSNLDGSGLQIKMGFGLRNPDGETSSGVDTRTALKPVMTVVYGPANDMLHAFRAGPCDTPDLNAPTCNDTGGEELWGFVPYDQLHTLLLRATNEPQGRNNHVYSLARGVRFADVFVQGAYTRSVAGMDVSSTQGLWRRILYFGRGIGGKYLTALDVTAPGPYTEAALNTTPPIPLWSRGNPDTETGVPVAAGGNANGTAGDEADYRGMGETWSIPVIAYVDKTVPVYGGKDYVLFVGSGYGAAGEGTTFYTLDAITGNVLAAVDVGSRPGFTAYPNALVANPVGFNPKAFSLLTTVHPAAAQVSRVYIGDVHGRLWKFLTARPDVALSVADLGVNQPVATAASLLGMPPQPSTPIPYIFVTSGADQRATGPFRMFSFRDDGTDTDTAVGAATTLDGVITYVPAVQLNTEPTTPPGDGAARTFDQGAALANCGTLSEAVFRGTVQPATGFECSSISVGTCSSPVGRVFFVGTRLSLPNTKFAPPTPLACSTGDYPCRSQFDSIIYALGALTGAPAYDLNASGDDAYRIFRDSRVAAITVQADPDPSRGGSSVTPDEGLMKGIPKPPPPPGVPPTSTSATANVVMVREPGQPAPAVRYGSTVCQ